ncbi:glutamate racemase [Companilactobacillus sp. RD055328]|uniref:glutamate racemase n=1 Tax=Companilactobacillus sp. RD055328 TaxID=2916634 RepID=UPI001FC86EEF|nr:glutamate racemase [Companilactobacillus sp. RD055328]GKQ42093.1 glutamate racemase [Companilactobacillus sp. RD055328]
MLNKNQAIGVLDSGIGGLTVLKQTLSQMPNEKFVFIGDQENMPYGPRTKEDVTNLTRKLVQFLISKNVKAIVFACNTATAEAMEEIQREVQIPLLGVIKPGSSAAVANTKKRLGIIATEGTIKSQSYKQEIWKLNSDMVIYDKATPTLVPMIESGIIDESIISRELQYFKDKNIESIVLGCTHYPIIREEISGFFDDKVKIIDPSYNTAEKLIEVLTENNMLGNQRQSVDFYTTADSNSFDQAITRILGINNPQSLEVNLSD